jgi:hypothetical protein
VGWAQRGLGGGGRQRRQLRQSPLFRSPRRLCGPRLKLCEIRGLAKGRCVILGCHQCTHCACVKMHFALHLRLLVTERSVRRLRTS